MNIRSDTMILFSFLSKRKYDKYCIKNCYATINVEHSKLSLKRINVFLEQYVFREKITKSFFFEQNKDSLLPLFAFHFTRIFQEEQCMCTFHCATNSSSERKKHISWVIASPYAYSYSLLTEHITMNEEEIFWFEKHIENEKV